MVLPANYTFTTDDGGDNGVHTFPSGVTLITPGDQNFTVTDAADSTITGSAIVTIVPSPTPPPGGNANGPSNPTFLRQSTLAWSNQQVALVDRLFSALHEEHFGFTSPVVKYSGRVEVDQWMQELFRPENGLLV